MKAIVIGAGIGGLSAAVALKQSGIDCDVYEAVKGDQTGRRSDFRVAQRREVHGPPRHGRHHGDLRRAAAPDGVS
ncbi:putative flavoprotein monooxygenase [Klebsiella pneumoniae]|uniref:Putative flavoprotein monooxygenase n=1 Tax=Klebsiella pneumoniae TaxID=573 RepID=A0A378C5M9_KLEPN|nr:putative flavoprotein monooxygenase [Klebsiella pneumoniae]